MKLKLILIFQLFPIICFAQQQKSLSNQALEDKVNSIYLANSVRIRNINSYMNSDMERYFKILVYNGRNKKITAVKINLDFNMLAGQNNPDLIFTKKFKIVIPPKSIKTIICKNLTSLETVTPNATISTVVYGDGTYEGNDAGIYAFYKEDIEKNAIRRKLLNESKK